MRVHIKLSLLVLLTQVSSFALAQSECIENGGQKVCSASTYTYALCDYAGSYCSTYVAWCQAHGGVWDAPNGCAGTVQCHNAASENEANIGTIAKDFFTISRGVGTCPVQTSDTGWGATWIDHDVCWTIGPEYVNGVETHNGRVFQFSANTSASSCQTAVGLTVIGRRDRDTCPPGYESVGSSCQKKPDATCPIGHPSQPASGNKKLVEIDIHESRDGGITFSRTYNSFGYYTPPGAATAWQSLLGRNWRTNFDKRVFAVSGSSYVMAIARRDDGTIKYFSSTGQEVPARNGVAEKLIKKMTGSQQIGWTYTASDDTVEDYDLSGRLTSSKSRNGRKLLLSYDSDGFLSMVKDDYGRFLQFEVKQGRLLSLVSSDGAQFKYYYYDNSDLLQSVQYPEPGVIREFLYGSNGAGNLTGVNEIDNGIATRYASYEYDPQGRVLQSYLGSNDSSSGLEKYQFTYSSGGTTVQTANGQSVAYGFTELNGVSRVASQSNLCASCGGSGQAFTYKPQGDLESSNDFNGNLTTYDYDSKGRRKLEVDAANDTSGYKRSIQTDWHATFSVPLERRSYDASSALKAKSTWTYNSRGQWLTDTRFDPVNGTQRVAVTSYCEQSDITAGSCPLLGLTKSVDGPRTDATDTVNYIYRMADEDSCAASPTTCPYRKGDLWKVTNALGQMTETLKYDGAGRVLSVKDPNGVITDYEYHPRGWMTARKVRGTNSAVETDDQITRIDYWPTGLVKQVTQPDGTYLKFTYDAAHRLTDITDKAGFYIHYTLDNAGNRTQEDTKNPAGTTLYRTIGRVYNALGQLATVKDAGLNRTDFTYDANGNSDTTVDALGRTTDNDYDPLNRLKRTLQDAVPGGINAETRFQYDALDNLTKVTDPKGLDTTYTYNGLSDLTQLVSPDTGKTTYTYDSAGNRKTQTDARGITSTYGYDALNRLTSIAYADTRYNTTYTYDVTQSVCGTGETFSKGRLTQLQNGLGAILRYCYDRFGNMTRKVQVINGKTHAVVYAYTKAGALQSVTYPGGLVVDYTRNSTGRVLKVGVTPSGGTRQELISTVSNYPFGPQLSWTYGNGRVLKRTHDKNYRPTVVSDTGVGGLSIGYGYDAAGQLTELRNPVNTAVKLARYDYDGLSRLSYTRDGPTGNPIDHYEYDATGNRTRLTDNNGVTDYTYPANSHKLDSAGGVFRGYDEAGNTIAIGGTARQFAYTPVGRMNNVKANGVSAMSYSYNGRGEQIRRFNTSTAVDQYYLYDEAGHWLAQYDSAGAPTQQIIWLDDMPVGIFANNQLYYVEPDHLGTPRVVIDPVPNVAVWKWDLTGEAFGATAPVDDPDGAGGNAPFVFDMRYPGQRYDAASGLNQNGFRDYEPPSGRYPRSDPIGLGGGSSTYGYVGQSPLQNIDPFGLQSILACANPANAAVCAEAGIIAGSGAGTDAAASAGAAAAAAGAASSATSTQSCPADDCQRLLAEIDRVVEGMRKKWNNLATDPLDLYELARYSNPGGALAGFGYWVGHIAYFNGLRMNLARLIAEAQAKGCQVPYSAYEMLHKTPPLFPFL